jgi:hypothetical protein
MSIVTGRWPTSVPYFPPIKVRLDPDKIADLIAMIAQLKKVKALYAALR